MKMRIQLLLVISALVSLPLLLCAQTIPNDKLYLGQTPPGNTPAVFASGTISLADRRETKIVFSPAGNECLVGVGESGTFKILYSKYENGDWSKPEPPAFILNDRAQEPFFSPDGNKIFYTSNADIYMSEKKGQTWAAAVRLGFPVNTIAEEYHPTVTLNGTLYFCSMRNNPKGDIYRSRCENGIYKTIEKLDKVIPSKYNAYDPFIAPDESYIIFTSIYPNGFGNEDQYISYYKDGHWTNPKNLGPKINTPKIEYGSYISPDNKYYFFSRPDGWGPNIPADIYWVSASFIDSLKHTNFAPYLKFKIPNQIVTLGNALNYQIPDSTFYDDDGNNTLTYSAFLSNGDPLPTWLSFNASTRTFSGTPAAVAKLTIKVTAADNSNASESCTFVLDVINAGGMIKTGEQLQKNNSPQQSHPSLFNFSTGDPE